MNKIAVCSTTMSGTREELELIKDRIKISNFSFFSSSDVVVPNSHPRWLDSNACYSVMPPTNVAQLYRTMAVSVKKQEAEFKQQNFFEVCFLIDSPFIESNYEVSMPEFVSEHTLYGIPSLILNQVLVERWRERVDMSPNFFFADTITFNIACDAYRYLNLDKGFVAMDITEFQYKFLKMNGIKFLAGIKL